MARHPAGQCRHGARHARRHRRADVDADRKHGRADGLLPRAGHRRADRDDSHAEPRREPTGQRERCQQRRCRPDQLHHLRCPRPQRRRVPHRARHSVLRAWRSADLLRRACSPAATTWTCCAARASGATSTVATTRPRRWSRSMRRPVVQSLLVLLRIRNTHPRSAGRFRLPASPAGYARARVDKRCRVRPARREPDAHVGDAHLLDARRLDSGHGGVADVRRHDDDAGGDRESGATWPWSRR